MLRLWLEHPEMEGTKLEVDRWGLRARKLS